MELLEYRLGSNAAIENDTKKEKFGIRFFYKDKINTLVIDKDKIKWFYSEFISSTSRWILKKETNIDIRSIYFHGKINSEIDYENKKVIFNCYNAYNEVCIILIFYNFDLEKVDKKVKRILLEREI